MWLCYWLISGEADQTNVTKIYSFWSLWGNNLNFIIHYLCQQTTPMPYDDDDDQIYDEPPEGMLCLQEPVKFIENFLVIFKSHWDV